MEAPLLEKILQMDPLGVTLVMGAVVSFTLALQYGGQTHAWSSSVVVGLLVGFVVMTAVFVAFEIWQGERAMIIPHLAKKRVVCVGAPYQFFLAGSYYAV